MYIKKIEINNFRIYKNSHSLFFSPEKAKNVFIISGNNGYGKTTFLTALIWCLYGKFMRDVDEIYKQQINELGGYPKFIQSCLNRLSYKEGLRDFSVSITFGDINIPTITSDEIKILRTGHFNRGTDELEIEIDGQDNELTKEVGNDLFIQDFILPKEVAKFFFFDSEKIVSLAENKSLANKRNLSKAYSEILGIKKYEELKKNLQDLTLRFRKTSAKPEDQKKFDLFKKEIENLENNIIDYKIDLDQLDEERTLLKKQSNDLQEKLIREGSALSVDEINNLKIEKYELDKEINQLKTEFKELLEFAPFAIVGNLMSSLNEQVSDEKAYYEINSHQEILNSKGEKLITSFKKLRPKPTIGVTKAISDYYESKLVNLVNKHLIKNEQSEEKKQMNILHQFDEEEYNEFNSLYKQLKTTYANRTKNLAKELRNKRLLFGQVSRKLSDAESKETDGIIAKYRNEKSEKDKTIKSIEERSNLLHQKIGAAQIEITSKKKVSEQLAKKIKVHERFIEKDKLAKRLISELDDFIKKIKIEKKKALEKRILRGLKVLMHKESFVKTVKVEVGEEIIDIILYNSRKEEINKDTLSKGEQQLYATSILRALVEESNLEFPVFIDSPLQKFDALHAENIISEFYPTISKQVVLFPLLEKEMTRNEYELLNDKVKSAFIIHNEHEDFSSFVQVEPYALFESAKKIQQNVLKY